MKGPRFDVERLRSALLHLCILCALSMLSASICIAKDGRLSDVWGAGWTPALSLGFGVQFQEISGRSAASFADFSQQGEANDILTGDFRGRIELAAPPFYEEGFSPRVFVHAGFNAPFSDEFLSERTNNSFSSTDPAFAANCSVTPPNPAILSCDTKARNSVTPNCGELPISTSVGRPSLHKVRIKSSTASGPGSRLTSRSLRSTNSRSVYSSRPACSGCSATGNLTILKPTGLAIPVVSRSKWTNSHPRAGSG